MSEATFIYAFIVDRRDTFQQVDSQRRGVSGIITQQQTNSICLTVGQSMSFKSKRLSLFDINRKACRFIRKVTI